ncbi:MAG: hypothetical protein MI919_19940, partial [Holophagales bacterium]|nr:hypothetical protein [Holophagales bacterium]
ASLLELRRLFASPEGLRAFAVKSQGADCQRIDDVFAYTNADAQHHALVLVNNSPTPRRGEVHESVPVRTERGPRRFTLAEALGRNGPRPGPQGGSLVGHDPRSGAEVTLPWHDGSLTVELGPYQSQVLLFPRGRSAP